MLNSSITLSLYIKQQILHLLPVNCIFPSRDCQIHTKSGTGTWLSSLFKGSQSLAAYFLWRFILYSGSSFDKRIPEYINNTKQCKKEGLSFKNRIFCQHSGFLKPHRSFYMALESASSRSSDRNIKRNRLCL